MNSSRRKLFRTAAVILTLILIFFLIPGIIYIQRTYPSDRITADITFTADGEACTPDTDKISGYDRLKVNGSKARIGIKAGKYGKYSFYVYGYDFRVTHFNSWNITKIHMNIDEDTRTGKATVSGYYTSLDDHGFVFRKDLTGSNGCFNIGLP